MSNVIYGLIDPNTNELRYIGYSCNVAKRYRAHHYISNLKSKTYKNNWIKSLIKIGQKPELIILEIYKTPEELPRAEIEMIEYYKFIGCNLTNWHSGGNGWTKGQKHTEETRKKLSEIHTGKKASEATRQKLSALRLGKKGLFNHSLESKMMISKANKGRKRSEECNLRNSLTHKGKILSEGARHKMSEAHKGMKHSDKAKKKISKARKHLLSEEQITLITQDYINGLSSYRISIKHNISRGVLRRNKNLFKSKNMTYLY